MGSAANSGIITIMPKLLVVALLFVLVVFALMYVVRRQDELEKTLEESQKTIVEARQKRYQLMKQLQTMFGNGNPYSRNVSLLIMAYEKVENEDMEIEWEKKYTKNVRLFMEYAQEHIPTGMDKSYDMAVQTLHENEAALTKARNEYDVAKKSAKAFLSPPLSYLGDIGDKTTELLRKHHENKMKAAEETDKENDQDG